MSLNCGAEPRRYLERAFQAKEEQIQVPNVRHMPDLFEEQ